MKFSEVFTALQTGVMDGQENPFTQIYSAKFQEVQKFLSLTGHVYTPAYAHGRREEVGNAAGRRAQGPRGHGEGDADVRLREGGEGRRGAARQDQGRPACQVNTPNKDAFVAASKPVYEEFAKEVQGPKELIDRAHRARQVGR